MFEEINNRNPDSEKSFFFKYQLVEYRYVTVKAKTIEEAVKRADKEIDRRIQNGLISGFRFDTKLTVLAITYLTNGFKKFKKVPYGNTDTDRKHRGLIIDSILLDNTPQ